MRERVIMDIKETNISVKNLNITKNIINKKFKMKVFKGN